MHARGAATVHATIALLQVADMARALSFYVDGFGFSVTARWEPEGVLRWCRLRLGDAHLMLQMPDGASRDRLLQGTAGHGVALYFQCDDALAIYRDALARGIVPRHEPQVGNGAWELFYADPDGYQVNFSSPTNLAEDTRLGELPA